MVERIDLHIEENSKQVSKLKDMLKSLGYCVSGPPDVLDEHTKVIVKAFRSDYNVKTKSREIMDSVTLDALIKASNGRMQASAQAVQAVQPAMVETLVPSRNERDIKLSLREGSTGADVEELKLRLKQWGYHFHDPDGVFGPQTDEALRAFQGYAGIAVDGVAGPVTWAALGNVDTGAKE